MNAEPRKGERRAEVRRKTHETTVEVALNLDGEGRADIQSPAGFLNHMLALLARHSLMDLTVKAAGDTDVDMHHTVEDVGICLGQAIEKALGDKAGITRFASASVPMDEALAEVALDLSGRPYLVFSVTFPGECIGDFKTQLVQEFLQAVVTHAKMTLHVRVPYGANDHHIAEAVFKALARALKGAVARDPRVSGTPSTKGVL
ncbi:MAG TPA: imidazoleglycerol-phosphate dehydratase HisB [Phycisphaerae bacterium]|nr:imidazoleglycerol-phosphate dehydratase HisB [Phycisphaerae bacterium]